MQNHAEKCRKSMKKKSFKMGNLDLVWGFQGLYLRVEKMVDLLWGVLVFVETTLSK